MKKRKAKVKWAEPDIEKDKAALKEFYQHYFKADSADEGLTTDDLAHLAELATMLKKQKKK